MPNVLLEAARRRAKGGLQEGVEEGEAREDKGKASTQRGWTHRIAPPPPRRSPSRILGPEVCVPSTSRCPRRRLQLHPGPRYRVVIGRLPERR